MSDQTRPIYLTVYPERLFAAHWAFWIPGYDGKTNEVSKFGKIIEVQGDPSQGFTHAVTRNHDLNSSERHRVQILLGYTSASNITDGAYEGAEFMNNTPTDRFEQWAMYIPAPGPTLRSVENSDMATSGSFNAPVQAPPPRRARLENCQTWCAQVLDALIENEIMGPEARDALNSAPKN